MVMVVQLVVVVSLLLLVLLLVALVLVGRACGELAVVLAESVQSAWDCPIAARRSVATGVRR
jgi:hypothetical protein